MNKGKIFMIASITILCISIIGSTTAYYISTLFSDLTVDTITYGLDYYINYTKGQDITSAELTPGINYTEGVSTDIELWKKDNTYDIYGHIYLDINEIGTNTSGSSALKYAVVNNDTLVAEGVFDGYTSGESLTLKKNIPLEITKQIYTIYVWVDENETSSDNLEGESLSLTVRCEATMESLA